MNRRQILLVAVGAIAVLAAGILVGRRTVRVPEVPSAPEVKSSGKPGPSDKVPPLAGAPPSRRAPAGTGPSSGAPETAGSELFGRIRRNLFAEFERHLKSGGSRGALQYLRTLVDSKPSTFEERLTRAYAFRFFPYLAETDPSLRSEVLELLQRQVSHDSDPYARFTALSALTDRPVSFVQLSDSAGTWMAYLDSPLQPGTGRYDGGCLGLSLDGAASQRPLVWQVAQTDSSWENRVVALRLLQARPQPADGVPLERAALTDADGAARYWAIAGLGKLPPEIGVPSLRKAMEADAEEPNREAAAAGLVGLGIADDGVISTLVRVSEPDAGTYDAWGKAYALSRSPSLKATIADQLMSSRPESRANGLRAVEASRSPDFLPLLGTLLETEKDERFRKQILEAKARLESKPR